VPRVTARRLAGPAACALLGALLAPAAAAADIVVYRCTAADGAVTLQNARRCPKGMREERRVLEVATSRAPPAVAPPAAEPAPAPVDAAAEPATDSTPRIAIGPAPPLFACRTWDGQRYYGDDAQPAARCAPLQAVGLDRRSATAAQACEMVRDTCEAVPEAARCEAWGERLRTAEGLERFGDADAAAAARSEAARVRTVLAATVCMP
jgi:hypothetical protein